MFIEDHMLNRGPRVHSRKKYILDRDKKLGLSSKKEGWKKEVYILDREKKEGFSSKKEGFSHLIKKKVERKKKDKRRKCTLRLKRPQTSKI